MLRAAALFVCVCMVAFGASGQNDVRRAYRPDIPGTFIVDIGVNRTINETPDNFDYGFWGSRTVNLYYQYPIRLLKSKFSLNPGAGLSLERFKFTNLATLNTSPDTDGTYGLVPASDLYPGASKSQLIANYFDIPVEIRFDTKPEDIARSFNVAVGVRGGVLIDSFTKVRYSEDGETKKIKDKQNHGVNPIRYGLYTRIGIGGFNFFGFYNSSSLFESGKGPQMTPMNTFTAGISINGF
ncbi:MAG: outer membrane beta-barrel protein [Cyclobacteriaceae bacterium]